MKKKGSLNHIYRLVWSHVLQAWVAVAEHTKGRGKTKNSRRKLAASVLSLTALACALPPALAGPAATSTSVAATTLPSGYQVTAGSATVTQSGNTLTVQESSSRAAINWQSFSIGSNATVNFVQPNSSAIILDRVTGNAMSVIAGALNANGQVFILNSNGVLFTKNASVDAGGLLASTLNISDSDFMAGRSVFTSTGSHAAITNQGALTAEGGSYVALVGSQVTNQGVISARLGSAVLASGDQVSLNFNGNSLVNVVISKGTLDALVSNQQAIYADGGQVILTAKAADSIVAAAVNNSGEIQAQTIANHNGKIYLLGDEGQVNVAGTLDVSAPNGGNGGFVETSAATVMVANGAKINSSARSGLNGSWLIDPNDFTIAASGGDMTGAALSSALGSGNVMIASSSGATAGTGNINVNDATTPVTWSANTLTLSAYNNININAPLNGSGTAGLALLYGQGAVAAGNASTYNVNAPVNLSSAGSFSTTLGSNGSTINYTIITTLGAQGSGTGTDLQGMSGNLAGNYVLGSNIDASPTGTGSWLAAGGFAPVGASSSTPFAGIFDGLGHTVSSLTINAPTTSDIGLFGYATGATMRNVGLTGAAVTGGSYVGILVGVNDSGTINNAYSSGTVGSPAGIANSNPPCTATCSFVGGLVGLNYGKTAAATIDNSYSSATVSGAANYIGGLLGQNYGKGGAVTVNNSYATGNVTGSGSAFFVGGLTGSNFGSNAFGATISNSHASGNVTGTGYGTGGLAAFNNSVITNSHAVGTVMGAEDTGGLIGVNYGIGGGGSTTNSYATGNVSGTAFVGGLIGANQLPLSHVYATGSVNGSGNYVGGLAGVNVVSINNAYSTGTVVGVSEVGGLTGYNTGILGNAFYDIDAVLINTIHQVTTGGLYTAQYTDWFSHSESLNIANYASTLPAGSGGYYNVASQQSLQDMLGFSESNAALNFRLTGNISLTSGFYVPYFAGSFDGAGYTLSNLNLNVNNSMLGMFGFLPTSVTILSALVTPSVANVAVTNANVDGNTHIGGLVGWNYGSGTITNSSVSGNVTAAGNDVGGLVGYNNTGAITGSHSQGTVNGSGNYVGGLVGYGNTGAISNSYSTASATGPSANGTYGVGGLVGGLASANVSRSYATGNVSGNSEIGGLVGVTNGGTISQTFANGSAISYGDSVGGLVGAGTSVAINNSYATGGVSFIGAGNNGGGLAGSFVFGSITDSYSTGAVNTSQGSEFGGLIGNGFGFTVAHNFYDKQTNPTLTGIPNTPDVAASVWGLTTAEMENPANFSSATSSNGNVNPNWNFGSTWFGYAGHATPLLQAFLTPLTVTGASATQVYDGKLFADDTVTYSSTPNQSELFGTLTFSGGGTNAGQYSVTPAGLWSDQLGYLITYVSGTQTITPLALVITTIPGATREFDGTTNAAANLLSAANLISGDTLTFSGNATLAGSATGNQALLSFAGLSINNPNYTLTGATPEGVVAITSNPDALTVPVNVVAQALFQGNPANYLQSNLVSRSNPGGASPTLVGNPTPQISATFGNVPLAIVSAPAEGETTAVVSISEVRSMMQPSGGNVDSGSGSDSSTDVRVPVARNSLAEIVNGGVKLPTGVEQQLFIVKDK